MNAHRWPILVTLFALAACGGGSSSALAPGTTAGSTPSAVTPFAVSVSTTSSITKVGIVSSTEAGSPEHTVDVSAAGPTCTTAAGTRTCTLAVKMPLGLQVLTANIYGAKTTHSSWRATLNGTRVPLAVGTAIAQISLDLAVPQLAGGASGTTTLYVTARDANGNTIVGDFGGASIAVTSSDTTGSVTIAPATITAGSTPVTVSYNGSGSVSSVTFNATSTGVPTNAIVDATLTFSASQLMYIAGISSILVFPANASGDVPPSQRISIPGMAVFNAQPDGLGKIWATFGFAGTTFTDPTTGQTYLNSVGAQSVGYVSAAANGVVTPTILPAPGLPSGTVIFDMGVDGSGNVYVLSVDSTNSRNIVSVIPNGSQTASRSVSITASICNSIAVNTDGTFAALCNDPTDTFGEIFVYAPGATTPTRTISGPATQLSAGGADFGNGGLAVAADGTLVTNETAEDSSYLPTTGSLIVFSPGANGNATPARVISGNGTGLNYNFTKLVRRSFTLGVGIDAAGNIDVLETASLVGSRVQLARFSPTASGAALPISTLGGPLVGLNGFGTEIHFSTGSAPVAPSVTPVVSGDFLALSPGRGWNYTMTGPPNNHVTVANPVPTPPAPTTLSLYSNPTTVNGDTELIAFEAAGVQPTAIGLSGSVEAAEGLFHQGALGGWSATGYVPISSGVNIGGIVPIPGSIGLVRGSLTQGQTFEAYPGVTATVISVGAVPGSSACPGGAATGAIVAYAFGESTETVGYVPGCGIVYFVSDNGSTAVLSSVGTYNVGQLSHERAPASERDIATLRAVWNGMFTPWRPR